MHEVANGHIIIKQLFYPHDTVQYVPAYLFLRLKECGGGEGREGVSRVL